jgi:hypothetical protein
MQTVIKAILCSALLAGISPNVWPQSAGGGAAGGQGGTGMSKPSAAESTGTVSGASGANTMAPSTTSTHKKMHRKAGTATPASATNPGSGGSG